MYRLVSAVIIILVLQQLHHSAAYKWIALKSGDPIPEEAIILDNNHGTYVGRAKHFNRILPAEVYNGTHAVISSCSKEIIKNKYEVLVATGHCGWKSFDSIDELSENIVRAGTAEDGEPIFIGGTSSNFIKEEPWNGNGGFSTYRFRLASIYMTSNKVIEWQYAGHPQKFALNCDDSHNWEDTSFSKIPSNAISVSKSKNDKDIFVARFEENCKTFPGTVTHTGGNIYSPFYQILVGDANQYKWIMPEAGQIPDYAVVAGKRYKELIYIGRENNTVSSIQYNDISNSHMSYEILVKHEEYAKK